MGRVEQDRFVLITKDDNPEPAILPDRRLPIPPRDGRTAGVPSAEGAAESNRALAYIKNIFRAQMLLFFFSNTIVAR